MPAPPLPFIPAEHRGKLVVMLLMCYDGDAESGAKAVAPFRALATPIIDMVRPIRYPEIFPPEDTSYHPTVVGRTSFIDSVDRAAAERILDALRRSDAPMRATQLRVLGGEMARVPNDATAFAHRDSPIMAICVSLFTGPEDRPGREAWVKSLSGAIDQGRPGAYVNFLGNEGEARVHDAYPGKTWDRLAAIKARYDPQNLFRLNQNVPPAH